MALKADCRRFLAFDDVFFPYVVGFLRACVFPLLLALTSASGEPADVPMASSQTVVRLVLACKGEILAACRVSPVLEDHWKH